MTDKFLRDPNIPSGLQIFHIDGLSNALNNIGGGAEYELQTVSTTANIDYKSDYDKITWSDTTLDTHNFYNYYDSPYKPKLRTPFVPTDSRATIVSNEAELDQTISDQKDNIFIATDFSITSPKLITFACKIHGDSVTKPTITAVGITTSLFNVSSDDVFFENLILTNDNTSSNTNCIFFGFNNEAKNNCVHDCVFNTNEFAIISSHYQVQIYNNVFQFVGTPDSHRYISLNRCVGEVLVYNNVFHSNGISSTACLLINSNNGSVDFDSGHLVIYGNVSATSNIQRVAIMETEPINFKLSLIENTISTYTDFFILYGDTMLNGFTEIVAYKNTVSLIPVSPGFKGAIGWDTPGSGGVINYSPIIRASLNVLPNNLRTDYSPLPNSTSDNPIVCFKNTKFETLLTVLINPPLVAFSIGVSKEEVDALETRLESQEQNIATNTTNIATNTTNIATNTTNIATNTTNVATNTTNIATNTTNIATNTTNIATNSTKTQYITDTNNNHTTFSGSLGCPTVYLDNIRPEGNNGGEIYVYKQNGALGLKMDTDGNFYVPTGSVSANSVIVNGTTPITGGGSGFIITTTERNNINSNVSKLVNQSAVSTPNPITTLVGELDVSVIKSYEHNCELQFNDTDASLSADGTVTLSAPTVILNGSVSVAGQAFTNQTSFTQDQQFVSKKYIDDANTNQNTVISSNMSANIGSVTVHSDVSSAGSGAIITASERNAIGSNSTKTQYIIDSNNNRTTFSGSLGCSTVYLDNIRPEGNNGGEIYVYKQNGTLGLKMDTDGNFSVASGTISSSNVKATTEVALGSGAGGVSQSQYSVAIGNQAGQTQGLYGVAIGNQASQTQGEKAVAIGYLAGQTSQSQKSVAIGDQAGQTSQGQRGIAIGFLAGNETQGFNSISIGNASGSYQQKTGAIAIGNEAGLTSQGDECIAIGDRAGKTGQVDRCIAIGRQAGETSQQNHAVAIGWNAGNNTQSLNSIAIGTSSGFTTQGQSGIAIGNNAGQTNQGANSIAIGDRAGLTNQAANSIVINATGTTLNAPTTGIFVSPVREELTAYRLFYNPTTGEISYSA